MWILMPMLTRALNDKSWILSHHLSLDTSSIILCCWWLLYCCTSSRVFTDADHHLPLVVCKRLICVVNIVCQITCLVTVAVFVPPLLIIAPKNFIIHKCRENKGKNTLDLYQVSTLSMVLQPHSFKEELHSLGNHCIGMRRWSVLSARPDACHKVFLLYSSPCFEGAPQDFRKMFQKRRHYISASKCQISPKFTS